MFLIVVGTEQFIGVGAGLLLVVPGFIIRCSEALESLGVSSCIVGIGVLLLVILWCILGWTVNTFGDVGSCDEDGCTLVSGCFTLGAGLFSVFSSSTHAASLKISVSLRRASVCFGLRSIGALDNFCIAVIGFWAANRTVSPGSMAGILQCTGKNFSEADV